MRGRVGGAGRLRTLVDELGDIGVGEWTRGPYIKDVRTERGEGGSPKADILREVAWIYSYRSYRSYRCGQGGGGQKSRKFCGRPLCRSLGSLMMGKFSQFTKPTTSFSKSMKREGGGAAFETD